MSIELERHCDGDCLHSKACEADYADQLEEQKEAEKELESRLVPVCGTEFVAGEGSKLGYLRMRCQLEKGHLGGHVGTIIR